MLILILAATSGDTGKAALEGFRDVPGTKVAVFYPDEGVAKMQRLQMCIQDGNNVFVAAVKGNFDDAQSGVKKIFTDNGFHIVYDYDATQPVGDGFFFTIGYGNMTGGELLKELLYYGVSSISLGTTGSEQNGVRACTSRMRDDLYDTMQERMKAFNEDHSI